MNRSDEARLEVGSNEGDSESPDALSTRQDAQSNSKAVAQLAPFDRLDSYFEAGPELDSVQMAVPQSPNEMETLLALGYPPFLGADGYAADLARLYHLVSEKALGLILGGKKDLRDSVSVAPADLAGPASS